MAGSLLDRVLDAKDNPAVEEVLSPKNDEAHRLPDGSVVYDSTIAAINRIFELNPSLYKRADDGALYNGREKINIKSPSTILSLLRTDWTPKTDWQLIFLQNKVMELAPILSCDCYEITDYLLWDRDTATLKRLSPNKKKDGNIKEEYDR